MGDIMGSVHNTHAYLGRKKKRKINDVNLIMLALSCSRIPLVQGGAYYLPCSGWALAYLGTYD